MQVFHFANLIHLSESGNVQLCGFCDTLGPLPWESPRGVLSRECVCVREREGGREGRRDRKILS